MGGGGGPLDQKMLVNFKTFPGRGMSKVKRLVNDYKGNNKFLWKMIIDYYL